MPWKERNALDERKSFIAEWKKDEMSFAELCRRYEISRPTGYLWVARYEGQGEAGLKERSRAPHDCPQAMSAAVRERILELRRAHPRWGPRKLRAYLADRQPQVQWPASFAVWLAGFFGTTVRWRDRRYYLHADGRSELREAPRQTAKQKDGGRRRTGKLHSAVGKWVREIAQPAAISVTQLP